MYEHPTNPKDAHEWLEEQISSKFNDDFLSSGDIGRVRLRIFTVFCDLVHALNEGSIVVDETPQKIPDGTYRVIDGTLHRVYPGAPPEPQVEPEDATSGWFNKRSTEANLFASAYASAFVHAVLGSPGPKPDLTSYAPSTAECVAVADAALHSFVKYRNTLRDKLRSG